MAVKKMSNKAAAAKRKRLKKQGKSGIVIKTQNRGKLTRWAKARGWTVSQAIARVNAAPGKFSPAVRKMVNFAKNARKWKK